MNAPTRRSPGRSNSGSPASHLQDVKSPYRCSFSCAAVVVVVVVVVVVGGGGVVVAEGRIVMFLGFVMGGKLQVAVPSGNGFVGFCLWIWCGQFSVDAMPEGNLKLLCKRESRGQWEYEL